MELISYECPNYGLFSNNYINHFKIYNEFFESNYEDAGWISYRIGSNVHSLIFSYGTPQL